MMDKKPSKCRFRVMKFEENAIFSSKNEMRAENVKPAKGSRGSRAPERSRSPDPQASTKDKITKQDRKSTKTVGKKPVKKIILNKRPNTLTGELKRIFSSTTYPELNSVRDSHEVGDKAKKTKKNAKGKRKKSNIPDYLRRYEERVTYKCETNKSPQRPRNEFPRYEQNRISPSMYYLSAGDSIEGELCKAPCEPKATDESCDCLPAEITSRNARRDKDGLLSGNSRKCAQDCTMWRVAQGKRLPICHCSSLNINANRQNTRKKCNCSTNKSGIPEHPTSTRQTIQTTDYRVDVETSPVAPKCHTTMCNTTSSLLQKNASCECPSLNMNITRRKFEKTTQPSEMLITKICSNTNTYADIGCNSTALANDSSKNVINKCPSSNTNSRSSHQLMNFNFSACECGPDRSNSTCHHPTNGTCECPSSNLTFKGRSSLTDGRATQCLAMPTVGSVSKTPQRRVNVHSVCPPLRCNPSQSTKCSACNSSNFSSTYKAGCFKVQTAIKGTDAPPAGPPTIPCAIIRTSSAAAPKKLCHSVSCGCSSMDQKTIPTTCQVNYVGVKTDCYPKPCSPLAKPKCIACNTSDLDFYGCKTPKTTQCTDTPAPPCAGVQTKHEVCSNGPFCNVSCGSFPVKRAVECASLISGPIKGECVDVKPSCPRLTRKPPRCYKSKTRIVSIFRTISECCKKVNTFPNFCTDVETNICSPPKKRNVNTIKTCCSATTSVPIVCCADAETGCQNNTCRAGPRRVFAFFQPILTRSTCYFYFVIYIIAMILCSPFVAIIYFCRFVTSPIRPGLDCNEICPKCVPPRPCPHALVSLFKSRQLSDQPIDGSHAQPTRCRVGKRRKTSSSCRIMRVVSHGFQQPSLSKTKRQRGINQHNTCRPAKERKRRTKTRSFQNDCLVMPTECSIPTSCENQIIPSKSSKPRSCEIPRIPSKCFKPRPCKRKRKIGSCFIRGCKKVVNFMTDCQCSTLPPKKKPPPRELSCEELLKAPPMPPPPPYFMFDSYAWGKPFSASWCRSRDSFYHCCAFVLAAIFWCPLGLCLYVSFKCFDRCCR